MLSEHYELMSNRQEVLIDSKGLFLNAFQWNERIVCPMSPRKAFDHFGLPDDVEDDDTCRFESAT